MSTFRPSEEQMELIESNKECKYHKYIYSGLTIFENWKHTHFNATVLMKQISKKTPAQMLKCKEFSDLVNEPGALWSPPKGTKKVQTLGFGGQYMEWDLFGSCLEYAKPGALRLLAKGKPLTNDTQGYLYFCKPDEKKKSCLNTDTVKVGRAWDWNRRAGVYHKDTILYRLIHVHDMYAYESMLQKAVAQILTHDTKYGDEYYVLKDDDEDKWYKMNDIFDTLEAINENETCIIDLKKKLEQEKDEERIQDYNNLIESYQEDVDAFKDELEHVQ